MKQEKNSTIISSMILNMRGPIGSDDFMWVEQNITFIAMRSLERINMMDSFKEKNDFLVKVINYFNREQASMLEKYLSECNLEEFYHELNETGILIHIPSDAKSSYGSVYTFYEENEWIKE